MDILTVLAIFVVGLILNDLMLYILYRYALYVTFKQHMAAIGSILDNKKDVVPEDTTPVSNKPTLH